MTAETKIIRDAVSLACRAPSLHNNQSWQWMADLATCTLTHITKVRTTRELVATLIGYDGQPQVLIRVGAAPAMENLPPFTPRRPPADVFHVQN